MPEYRFVDPILEDIHDSLRRMQEKIDFMVSFFSRFFSLTPRSALMQDRDIIPPKDLSLSGIQKAYEYLEPVTFKNFSELEEPVIDSEGFVREKKSPYIGKSLYTKNDDNKQMNDVEIIESADIKKIQKDQRNLESKFTDISNMFVLMMNRFDEQKKIMENQTAEIASLNRKLDECKYEMADMKKTIETQQKTIEAQQKTIENQGKIIEKQNLEMADMRKTIDNQTKKIDEQGKIIRQQTVEIKDLKKTRAEQKEEIFKLKDEVQELRNENQVLKKDTEVVNTYQLNKKPVSMDVVKSSPWRPGRGFLDTFGYLGPCRSHKRTVEELKMAAYEGELMTLASIVKSKDVDLNGRGMPDSICSIAKGFRDKTALMLASQKGRKECVEILVKNGANVNSLDRENFTALDYAQQNHRSDVISILKKNGALNGVDLLGMEKESFALDIIDSHDSSDDSPRLTFKTN